MPGKKSNVFALVLKERFRQSAIVADYGYRQEDHAMQLAGLRAVDRAAKQIDMLYGPEGRLELAPCSMTPI
jgi:hypothetical protein